LNRFVLDASVALAWFIDHPIAPYAKQVQQLLLSGHRAVVPSLWRLEVANGFLTAERRGILVPSDTTQILQNFEIVLSQAIEGAPQALTVRRVIATARQFQLTAYDAEYLETARNEQLPLATLDRRLQEAAAQAGVALLR
jgi:predicted nucleic acid-binding protein